MKSRIWFQALESEAVKVKFHKVYERLTQALDGLPYDQLGISDEVNEQVLSLDCNQNSVLDAFNWLSGYPITQVIIVIR